MSTDRQYTVQRVSRRQLSLDQSRSSTGQIIVVERCRIVRTARTLDINKSV